MITSELVTHINFDEEKDRQRISSAIEVMIEIKDAFAKAGTGTEDVCSELCNAIGILDNVLEGERF